MDPTTPLECWILSVLRAETNSQLSLGGTYFGIEYLCRDAMDSRELVGLWQGQDTHYYYYYYYVIQGAIPTTVADACLVRIRRTTNESTSTRSSASLPTRTNNDILLLLLTTTTIIIIIILHYSVVAQSPLVGPLCHIGHPNIGRLDSGTCPNFDPHDCLLVTRHHLVFDVLLVAKRKRRRKSTPESTTSICSKLHSLVHALGDPPPCQLFAVDVNQQEQEQARAIPTIAR
jgi:hypothetical protein